MEHYLNGRRECLRCEKLFGKIKKKKNVREGSLCGSFHLKTDRPCKLHDGEVHVSKKRRDNICVIRRAIRTVKTLKT